MQDFACIAAELIAWCPREGMDVEDRHYEGRFGQTGSLAELDVILDVIYVCVSVPVLGVAGVFPDGRRYLLGLELCGSESFTVWKDCLDDLVARGLQR